MSLFSPLQLKLRNRRLILASGSPRRKLLMEMLGVDFEVYPVVHTDEQYPDLLRKEEIAMFLAEHKSASPGLLTGNDAILITADTIVWCNGIVLGKPSDRREAISTLQELSGRDHLVITGVCIKSPDIKRTFSSTTVVTFRDLEEEEIVYYVDKYHPYDKAGGYGIQEWIGLTGITSINGSYFNVMGLPVDQLYQNLLLF